MGYTQKTWNNPINLDANNLNRIEQGIKNSHDTLEIISEEVSNLQIRHFDISKSLNTLLKDSPNILTTLNDISSIINNNDVSTLLTNVDNFLTKKKQNLSEDEIKQIQSNLKLDKFLKLTDITVNNKSIVQGSTANIAFPDIDSSLNINSSNLVTNKAVAEEINKLYYEIEHLNISPDIEIPTKLSDLLEDNLHMVVTKQEKDLWNSYKDTFLSELPEHNHDTLYSNILHTHPDIIALIPVVPTDISAFNNDMNYATENYVKTNGGKIDSILVNNIAQSIIDKTVNITIPTDLEDLTNNAGYIKNNTEIDPTVPAWAKEPIKPFYDYNEILNTPKNLTDFKNDANFVSKSTLDTAINTLNDLIEDKSDKSHTHTKSEISDFNHTHTKSNITDFSHTHTKSNITDFSHTHTESEITDLQDYTLKGHTHTLSNITDAIKLTDLLVPYGTNIPANADLNSVEYLKVGHYHHPSDNTVQTLKNCPTTSAFNMKVYSPLSTTIDNEETGVWMYRLRELTTYTGTTYRQLVNTNETPGVFIFNNWIQISDNTHTHDYLPLSGGTITGDLITSRSNGIVFNVKDDIKYRVYGDSQTTNVYTRITLANGTHQWYPLMDSTGNLYSRKKEVATKEDIPTDYVKYQEDTTTTWTEANLTTILNKVYPIGAVYLSVNTTSPATLFGGTWTELSSGRALWITSVSSGNAGQTIAAGLPNITGSSWGLMSDGSESFACSGAIYANGAPRRRGWSGVDADEIRRIGFDASRSNAIYGNSTTVQPPAIRVYAWKRTA